MGDTYKDNSHLYRVVKHRLRWRRQKAFQEDYAEQKKRRQATDTKRNLNLNTSKRDFLSCETSNTSVSV